MQVTLEAHCGGDAWKYLARTVDNKAGTKEIGGTLKEPGEVWVNPYEWHLQSVLKQTPTKKKEKKKETTFSPHELPGVSHLHTWTCKRNTWPPQIT